MSSTIQFEPFNYSLFEAYNSFERYFAEYNIGGWTKKQSALFVKKLGTA